MLALMQRFIRVVDAVNYRVGRVIMYGIFVLMGILLWSSISKTFFLPTLPSSRHQQSFFALTTNNLFKNA